MGSTNPNQIYSKFQPLYESNPNTFTATKLLLSNAGITSTICSTNPDNCKITIIKEISQNPNSNLIKDIIDKI